MENRLNGETRLSGPQIAVYMDFENVATSAEANFGEFDVTAVMDLLRTRGRLLIKRAYGDWGRFHRYRRAMLENGVDLFQLYSVGIQQKNRADVRLAIDAIETVFTRPNIDVYVVVSGDSDFTELIHKLRDHGKYTMGIGLHAATSDLLRRACDEFIFYETLMAEGMEDIADELQLPDPRELLRRALIGAEQKGETPIFAGRLKQMMLGLDSSFNEANYGYQQFRTFLEAHADLVSIQEQGLQLYISLKKAAAGPAREPSPEAAHEIERTGDASPSSPPPAYKPAFELGQRYRSFLREVNLRVVEPNTRGQALADFLTVLQAQPGPVSLSTVADLLKDRYDAENALTQKIAVLDMARLLVVSEALTFAGGQASSLAPIRQAADLTLAELAQACDTAYIWRLVEGGVPVYADQLAPVLHGPDADPAAVAALCDGLVDRGMIVAADDTFAVAPQMIEALLARPELRLAAAGLTIAPLPADKPVTPMTAEALFREASDLRQKDFAGSAQRYLQAARVQLEALRGHQPRAGLDDLCWYLASYCSVKAGHAFVTGSYGEAIPYYLAFFNMAQEAESVWPRIQRLVQPMAAYFFAIAGKQLNQAVPPNLGRSPAAQVALRMHNHDNPQVVAAWEALMLRLADANLGLLRQTHRDLSGLIDPGAQGSSEGLARIERTRAWLSEVIAQRESTAD
jgi:uncharacterized protein (TIGR00288 family)